MRGECDLSSVSVVIATYNGEKFILEQLESIKNQTMTVEEVIISDDGSSDSTIIICEEYINRNSLKDWRITHNKDLHGFYYNFCNGMKLVTKDLMLLCDQDDVWLPDKVKEMKACFDSHQDMLSLVSTFSRFNENGVLCTHQKHPVSRRNILCKILMDDFLNFYNYLGMSMMVRLELLQEFLKIYKRVPGSFKSHDIILNLLAVQKKGFYYLDRVLTKRRSYLESTSNRKNTRDFDNSRLRSNQAFKYQLKIDYLKLFDYILSELLKDCSNSKRIRPYIQNYAIRVEYIEMKEIVKWMRNIVNIQYYDGIIDYIKDIFRIQLN